MVMDWRRNTALYFIVLTIIPLGLICLLAMICAAPTVPTDQAHQGSIDLTGWDWTRRGPAKLNGQWEFYWNRLLPATAFHQGVHPSDWETVPQVWNHYHRHGRSLPGEGYATYRLTVVTAIPNQVWALKIATIGSAYRVQINGKTVAQCGTVSSTARSFRPQYRPQIILFKSAGPQLELVFQVANFSYGRGGIWLPLYLGTPRQIIALQDKNRRRESFLLGAIFVMILYHLAVYLVQKRYRFHGELYFIFLMVLFGIRIICMGEYQILAFFPNMDFKWMVFGEYFTIYWSSAALALFVQELFPDECSPRFLKGALAFATFLTVVTLITPVAFYTRFNLIYEGASVAMVLYYLGTTWHAVINRRISASWLYSTIVFSAGMYILEALYHQEIYHSKYEGIFPVVNFAFIVAQALILARRSAAAYTSIDTLSQRLLALDKIKDEFMANTSHELRTPLHGMISMIESVLESAPTIPETQQESLRLAATSGKRLANLVNDLLDYEKLKYNNLKLHRQAFDIRPVIAAALEVSRYSIVSKPLNLTSRFPEKLPDIYADEARFTQIIYNLLGNAIKFTATGAITVSATVHDKLVAISVSDTGIGIPADQLDHIFESFEQVDTGLADQNAGSGLGLSITKYLVESHGGQIRVESTPGAGSTFTFTMPVSTESNPVPSSLPESRNFQKNYTAPEINLSNPVPDPASGSKFTILAVDDDFINIRTLATILTAEHYTILTVSDGPAALEMLNCNKEIDLVILDIMLPELSGYTVCQKIREEYSLSELPVLLMTAQHSASGLLTGFAAGANDFLFKPFEPSELKARVKTLLQLKKSVGQAIQSELAFLQAQIKPHFLYNAINTIISFCWTDAEKAGQLLLALSDYLRGSFNFNDRNQFISLEKELELVEAYVEIEKARFENKLNCSYQIDVSREIMIPPLIIQPLVENAIKHGILAKEAGGTVIISVTQAANDILITIKDDGVGIPPKQLATILTTSPAVKNIGLNNINRRIKRLYGSEILITSEVNVGTSVTVKIPVS